MDTLDMRGSGYGFYSSSGIERQYVYRHYHPYRRSENKYFLDKFKKAKLPTFDGELKKLGDVEAWLLGMKKLFKLHDYIENRKAKIVIFSLQEKANM